MKYVSFSGHWTLWFCNRNYKCKCLNIINSENCTLLNWIKKYLHSNFCFEGIYLERLLYWFLFRCYEQNNLKNSRFGRGRGFYFQTVIPSWWENHGSLCERAALGRQAAGHSASSAIKWVMLNVHGLIAFTFFVWFRTPTHEMVPSTSMIDLFASTNITQTILTNMPSDVPLKWVWIHSACTQYKLPSVYLAPKHITFKTQFFFSSCQNSLVVISQTYCNFKSLQNV